MNAAVTFPINGMLVVLILVVAAIAVAVGQWFLDKPTIGFEDRPARSHPVEPQLGGARETGRASTTVAVRRRPYDYEREADR